MGNKQLFLQGFQKQKAMLLLILMLTFKTLLKGYFQAGGMQHQPNVSDAEELKKAQANPEKYKDLIVRLWGVSAHFVDLPKELQDEMIARFS